MTSCDHSKKSFFNTNRCKHIRSTWNLQRTLLATLIGVSVSTLMTGCATDQWASKTKSSAESATPQTPPKVPLIEHPATKEPAIISVKTPITAVSIEQITNSIQNDAYHPLEQLDRAETQHWMKNQHDLSRHYLADLIQASKKKKLTTDALLAQSESSPLDPNLNSIQRVGSRLFYFRANDRLPRVLYLRDNLENKEERELVNLNHMIKLSPHTAIEHFRVSPDGRWVALIINTSDTNNHSSLNRHVIIADAKTGKPMVRPIANIEPSPFFSWRPDSGALFFVQKNESGVTQVVMRLLTGELAGKTFPVFGPQLGLDTPIQADEHVGILTSSVSPYTLAIVQSPKGIRIFSALAPQLSGNSVSPVQTENGTTPTEMHTTWYPLIGLQDQVSSFDLRGDWFYAITRRQKDTGELVRLRLSEPRWEEADLLIPADDKQNLNQLRVAQDALYVEKREEGYSHLIKLPYNARYQNTGELQSIPEKAAASGSTSHTNTLPTPADMAKTTPVQPGGVAPQPTAETSTSDTSTQVIAPSATSAEPKVKHKRHRRSQPVQTVSESENDDDDTPKVTKKTSKQAHKEASSQKKAKKNQRYTQVDDDEPSKKITPTKTKASKTAVAKQQQTQGKHTANTKSASQKAEAPTHGKKKSQHIETTEKTTKSSKHKGHISKQPVQTLASKHDAVRKHGKHRRRRVIVDDTRNEATEQRRARVRSRVIRLALPTTTPNTQDIKLPVDGMIQQLIADPLQSGVLARMNNWTRPLEMVHIDGQHEPHLIESSPFSQSNDKEKENSHIEDVTFATQTSRLLVPADDTPNTTMLPLTLISREGINPANSQKPLLLILDKPGQGFAAPTYRPDVLTWLKKGGVVALADVFPKGLKENEWLDQAQHILDAQYVSRLENIVDYLLGEKITSPDRLVAIGEGVNASLLANLLVAHPNQLTAAVLQAGVYDTLSWEPNASTKAASNPPENPKQEEHLKQLWAVSSYHHIKDQTQYPSVLALGNTDRKLVIQAAKLTAHLQSADSSNHAYFYSAAKPLSDETRLLFLWNQITNDSTANP